MNTRIKVYIWDAAWADGGSLMVVAHTVHEARTLLRARDRAGSMAATLEKVIARTPDSILRAPCVISGG